MTFPLARPPDCARLRGFAVVHGRRIETASILPQAPRPRAPHLVFLHGAYGSLSAWERFPHDVARGARCPAFVYSRGGHGHSEAPARPERADYLHAEALSVLPALLDTQGIARPVLVGHEDGATIALLHAAAFDVAAVVALSPRLRVDEPVASAAAHALGRLAAGEPLGDFVRRHRDPGALLARWATVWRADDARAAALDTALPRIAAPVLLVQGDDDEHASPADFAALVHALRGRVQVLQLEAAGGQPWQDAPRAVTAAISALVDRLRP